MESQKESLNKASLQRLLRNDNLTPTLDETKETLSILHSTFKEQQLSTLIQRLSFLIIQYKSCYQQVQESSLRHLLFMIFTIPQKRFSNIAYNKRQAAKVYVREGFDFHKFQEHIRSNKLLIQLNQYQFKHIVCDIITQTYKSVQQMLLRQFQDIERLNEKQLKQLHPYLLNLSQNFSQQSTQVFLRAVKNLYALERYQSLGMLDYFSLYQEIVAKAQNKVEITAQEQSQAESSESHKDFFAPHYQKFANKYYEMKRYRTAPKHHLNTEDKPHIWTTERELQLIALYLQHKKVSSAREIMKLKYRYQSEFTQLHRVKRKFNKILRLSVRSLQRFYQSHRYDEQAVLPKMIQLEEDKVKLLIGGPYKIKAYLCEIYRQHSMSYQSICQAITQINAFLKEKTRYNDYSNQNRKEDFVFDL